MKYENNKLCLKAKKYHMSNKQFSMDSGGFWLLYIAHLNVLF